MTSRQTARSARVYATTVGLPLVPDEAWIRTMASPRHREEAERVVLPEVILDGEREPAEVGEAREVAPACQGLAIERQALGRPRHAPTQALELQGLALAQRHRLRLDVPDHGVTGPPRP
jgi:hypothetical protein